MIMDRSAAAPRTATIWLVRAVAVAVIFGVWFYLNRPGGVSRIILPSPDAVGEALVSLLGRSLIWSGLLTTVIEIFAAFTIAAVAGVTFGFWAARHPTRARVLESMLAWGYMVPLVLFYPIFVLWFGVDVASKIAYAATSAFFPIAYNSLRGFTTISPTHLRVARAFGASRRQTDLLVKIPAGLPMLGAGLRIGAATSMITVIFCEMVASSRGLGHILSAFTESLATPRTFSMIVIIMCVVGVLQSIVAFVISLPTRKYNRATSKSV